jgi:enolase
MAKIKHISAREILNAAGRPSIEVTVTLSDDSIGIASCPAGMSVGSYEAVSIIDHDDNRFNGFGVLKAVENIETIVGPKLQDMEATKQQVIDRAMIELDGTQNKSRLGGNAMLAVSMAVAKAAADSSVLPLYLYLREFISTRNAAIHMPTPLFDLMNGGLQDPLSLDFESFMILPSSATDFSDSLNMGSKTFFALQNLLKTNNLGNLYGVSGGFQPSLSKNEEALSYVQRAVESASLRLGFDVFIGIDAAATQFYKSQQYHIKDKDGGQSAKDLNAWYQEIMKKYNILYLEDPLSEDDWDGWQELAGKVGQSAIIVGDDLVATNPYRLQLAIDKKAVSGVVIKPTQIGTVIEALAVVEVARAANLKIIVSDRTEETDDDFIADFAVAVSSDYMKFGPPAHGERVAKYNRLLQIESQLKLL